VSLGWQRRGWFFGDGFIALNLPPQKFGRAARQTHPSAANMGSQQSDTVEFPFWSSVENLVTLQLFQPLFFVS
jgi:hypothetical protein